MRQSLFALAATLVPFGVAAQEAAPIVEGIVADHILPRFEALAETTQQLDAAAAQDCAASSDMLRAAYNTAFDTWISASHLRFGPTEVGDRAFALAFWPDSRGATPRALSGLITDEDPIATSEDYAQVSIAARGFYAMEFLLYDETLSGLGQAAYRCDLVRAITADMAAVSTDILDGWLSGYAGQLLATGPDETYHSDEEVLQELLGTLTAGLEFTSDVRLGRPLGTFDRPRASRAENWRSGRSAHNVELSLTSLRDLALRLSARDADLTERLDAGFARALALLADLNDPAFAGVDTPQSRIRIEVVQQAVDAVRALVREELGPELGVAAGFNSLDGD